MICQNDIARNGFAIGRNLLSRDDIARLRCALVTHFQHSWQPEGLGKHQPNAAVEIPAISWVFTHPSILAFLREQYGRPDLVFTGNCDAHMNMLSWWHKDTSDNRGGSLPGDYFSREDCNLYRVGIYLQDHAVRDGLTVRLGSHRSRSLATGDIETLLTRAGDVIVFDLRLTHAGRFANSLHRLILTAGNRLRCAALITKMRAIYKRIVSGRDKLSIFFTYGTPGPAIDYFCAFEYAAKKEHNVTGATYLPAELIADLRSAEVDFCSAMDPLRLK